MKGSAGIATELRLKSDPAAFPSQTNQRCEWLIRHAWDAMTDWERKFCQDTYSRHGLTRKQHIITYNIYRKYHSPQPQLA